jgi:zinc/manganese transport system substrate-binding protein
MRVLFFLLLLVTPLRADAALRVVATVPDLAAIAKEVGGDRVTVTAMVLPTQDPHFVDARPNLALDLSRADLLLLVGLDLEVGWLPNLLVGARNPKVQVGASGYLDCSQFVPLLDVPTTKVDRAMGDVHPGGNPHYLYDPRNGARVARGIAERMGELEPANRQAYADAANAFVARLDAARARWESTLAPLRGREVVTHHKSMTYLADWLGFSVPITIEPKPGIPPNPGHVARVVSTMDEHDIRLVFIESYYPPTNAELIRSKVGAKIVTVLGGANFPKGETYEARFDALVAQLLAAVSS